MTRDAACTCQPEGGLPHNEVPYDYGYDDPADCPVHGKAASAAYLARFVRYLGWRLRWRYDHGLAWHMAKDWKP